MEVTGRVIRTDKSWWYLFEYICSRGKWVAADVRSYLDLVAKDADGQTVSLYHIVCDEASEILDGS